VSRALRYPLRHLIANGTRLGPYEITAHLGSGGMGDVYRARDSRLERSVAIKVLPSRFASDPRLRERFEREAKAISSLSHPNICTLYDVGSHDSVDYLVMEYLDGESLAERIARGPLPLDQVIRYGIEIADALEKAHRAGIVHRDLKPGNVVLTKGGAKLLDFGLAKFAKNASDRSDPDALTAAMSRQKPLTEEGSILGTFQYMAPEQIEGQEADARTDIFALGVLLYEMATGRRAFEAKTKASLIAAILERDPPSLAAVQPLTPHSLERVVKTCMAKEPDDRWQSAHDVALELRWVRDAAGSPAPATVARRSLAGTLVGIAGGILLGALLAWLLLQSRKSTAPPPALARFTVQTSPAAPLLFEYSALALSPDGRHLVYRALVGETPRLFLRALDSNRAVAIEGGERAHSPVFSPDGRWIAFIDSTENALYRVPREGGSRTRISDFPGGGLGLDWAGDTIYATRAFAGGLWAVPVAGGAPRKFATPNPAAKERALVWPSMIPGTDYVLATAWNAGSWDSARIVAYSIKDGTSKLIIDGGHFARYSPTGHVLFMRGGTLHAVPFDRETMIAGQNAVPLVNSIAYGTADGEAQYALSAAGHLAFATGGDTEPVHDLTWIDKEGKRTAVVPTKRRYGSVALAPDERTAIITLEGSTYDVWQLDIERDSVTRISHGGDDADGIVTTDGSRVVWSSSRTGTYNLYWRALDGSGSEELLAASKNDQFNPMPTNDAKSIVYTEFNRRADIWMMSLVTRQGKALLATDFGEHSATVSPDGRWLAYSSDESGQDQVYVTSFPQPSGKWQISTDGGSSARWMPDGRALVYGNGRKLYRVPFESEPRPRGGKPVMIAEGRFDDDYAISADGRICIIEGKPEPTTSEFHVVLNWAEELKRRVPASP
jgi:Tol biopolymer transport system component/predicted Ser/Thr protein kinase